MEFPFYLRLGSLRIHPHWIFETLAYIVAFRAYLALRKRHGDSVSDLARWWVIAAAAVGAALGSKLLYWLEDPWATLHHWRDPAYLMAGKTIVGGLLGGLVAVEWMKRRMDVRQSTGDLFAVPLALGIGVGRVGCFLTGLSDNTYGEPSSLPWAVDFGDGVPRHPTQVYEIILLLCVLPVLWRMMRSRHHNGDVFKVFMVSYAAWRLAVDFLKPRVAVAELSFIQWACLGLVLYYARHFWRIYFSLAPERMAPDSIGDPGVEKSAGS